MVRDAYPRVAEQAGDDALADDVAALGARVFELSEFLVDKLGVEDVGAYYPHRVTYHQTCHSLRLLRVGDKPLRLLRAVRGHRSGRARGVAGVLRLRGHLRGQEPDVSTAMLADKIRHVLDTRAEVCAAADNSCLMHIGGGLSACGRARGPSTSPRSWRRRNEPHERVGFPAAAKEALADTQLRRNIARRRR
jgi:L-lactate dehydrogenase complex protein LldE